MLRELPWDGSHLGSYSSDILIPDIEYPPGSLYPYITLNLGEKGIHQVMSPNKYDIHLVIADELKPLFQLAKLGTHTITVGRKQRVLFKPYYKDKVLTSDIKLGDWLITNPRPNDNFIRMVQDIIMFRYLIGTHTNAESRIVVRQRLSMSIPYSCNEKHLFDVPADIPSNLRDKWIDEYPLVSIVKRMIGIRIGLTQNSLYKLREEIEGVLRRISPSHLPLGANIIAKIYDCLNSEFPLLAS